MSLQRNMRTIAERLETHSMPEPNTGCTLWFGARNGDGYGALNIDDRLVRAHRLAWEQANGTVANGLCVLHRCDERLCINPSHLFLGTRRDNSADKVCKGRQSRGLQHGVKMRGDRNGSRIHPENLARGDRNGSRIHPERIARGEQKSCAKLTADDVLGIRKLRAGGLLYRELATRFDIHISTVARVATSQTWRHVKEIANA